MDRSVVEKIKYGMFDTPDPVVLTPYWHTQYLPLHKGIPTSARSNLVIEQRRARGSVLTYRFPSGVPQLLFRHSFVEIQCLSPNTRLLHHQYGTTAQFAYPGEKRITWAVWRRD
jgi:hypothetical protein